MLPYVTGGFAYGNVASTIESNGIHFDNTGGLVRFGSSADISNWLIGYALGAGVDWAVANDWRLRAEYLYISLVGGNHAVAGVAGVFTVSNAMDMHLAKFAVIRRFAALP